jgi:hypothetical protein
MRVCVCREHARSFIVHLVDMNHAAAFTCPVCRHLPDKEKTVCCDGIVMGFLRRTRLDPTKLTTDGAVGKV